MITPVVTQVDLHLSDRCNLNCSFCYTHGGFGNSFDQIHIDKVFDWIINQFDAGATEEQRKWGVRVSIYGGEPLVEWEHLKSVVVSKKAQGEARNVRLQFSIITNMTLLTEEKLDWLIANHVGIHPSIDGIPAAQDMERKYADGSGSSTVVYENARRLLSKIGGRSCRMTIAPSTVQYTYDSVVFLTKDIGFKTVNAVLAGGVNWTDELIEVHKQQIEQLTDWWIQEMREGRHWTLYHLKNMFDGMWSGRRMKGLCSAGVSLVGIDTQGNFYPCHRFCNLDSRPEYLMGNLDTGFTNLALRETFRTYDISEANKERCKDCPAILGCHAFCIHEMMIADRGMFEPVPHFCKVWPFYWKMAVKAHDILMAENNQLYLTTYDPKMRQRTVIKPRPVPVKKAIGEKPYTIARVSVSSIRMGKAPDKTGNLAFTVQYRILDTESSVRLVSKRHLLKDLVGLDNERIEKTILALLPRDVKTPSVFVRVDCKDMMWKKLYLDEKNVWNDVPCGQQELADAGLNPDDLEKIVSVVEKMFVK